MTVAFPAFNSAFWIVVFTKVDEATVALLKTDVPVAEKFVVEVLATCKLVPVAFLKTKSIIFANKEYKFVDVEFVREALVTNILVPVAEPKVKNVLLVLDASIDRKSVV